MKDLKMYEAPACEVEEIMLKASNKAMTTAKFLTKKSFFN